MILEKHPALFGRYKHIFNFTLTGDSVLEPGIRSTLDDRIMQLGEIARMFGPQTIQLRFDPIVVYSERGVISYNCQYFATIIQVAAQLGINKIIIAFCLSYPKVEKRMAKYGKTLINLTLDQQKAFLNQFCDLSEQYGVHLQTCCISGLIGYRNITASQCIDGQLIRQLCPTLHESKKDTGQRPNCNCIKSRDVGSYSMICEHRCFYCYASK